VTVVVKLGGARAVDPGGAIHDVATLVEDGEDVVVVHGGSTAVDDTLEALGEDPEYVETPDGVVGRFTDEKTMETFSMVLPGRINTDLVVALQDAGVNAVGLSGVDGGLLSGPRTSAVRVVEDGTKKIRRGDHSGRIESVEDELLSTLLSGGYTPVVTVPMLGEDPGGRRSGYEAGELLAVNVDTDRAAAAVAGALSARLVVLTDVPGVLEDVEDPESVVDSVATPEEMASLEAAAEGFMRRKVMAATEALETGAESVAIATANADEPVSSALSGAGTEILPGALGREDDSDGVVA
jgi:acetylglutamate/LysW-gamma-L-alpha-aminoadipate kinase